ncbi:MAG: selenoneine synthase SenA [Usitatibacter sp.]
MQTTGLAEETIGPLYEGERLAQALRDARDRTLHVYAHLDLEALTVPRLPIVNPPLWELSHIAWFQERWCLRHSPQERAVARGSLLQGADAMFDSTAVAHATRWSLPYPPASVLRGYMEDTFDATLGRLHRTPPEERYFFALALLHEDMHAEALRMTLQTLGLPGPQGDCLAAAASAGDARDIAFPAGELEQGTARDCASFVFDNEKWAHTRSVPAFQMADRAASQGEFAQFVDDGGYRRKDLWSVQGRAWLEESGRSAPLDWRPDGGSWSTRRFDAWRPLAARNPMERVSQYEAEAFCRWARRRLPSETEWEYAARSGRLPGTGQVWEWTSTPFLPYPGFSADPYKEYSQPWFESHFVLRGGCYATQARLVHDRFRNFYLPERADPFAGLRTCALE